MQNIDYILDFTVHLGREMLQVGANLERVNTTMELVCKSYGLHEVSIFSLSTTISVSAKNNEGETRVRQLAVPSTGIHLERLRRLNDLSYKVCNEKPDPSKLEDMLYEAQMVPAYSAGIELLGNMIAILSLCRIFGGGWQEMLVTAANVVILFAISRRMARAKLNRVITNAVNMCISTCIIFFVIWIGFAEAIMPMLTAISLMFIPGVPLVNSVRNLFCGNEMNGILELLKVLLEVATIVAGIYIAYFFIGRWYTW